MSIIPGTSNVLEKLPELQSARGFLRAAVTVLGPLGIALAALIFLDGWWPFLALVMQGMIYLALRWLMGGFFRGRQERLPYTDAFFNRFLPATGLNVASMLFVFFATGPRSIEGGDVARLVPLIVGVPIAAYLMLSAVLLTGRALQSAGIDTLFGVYVYYPDEGAQIEGPAYKVVRHPIYAALDRLVIAFGLLSGTTFGVLLAVIFVSVWHPIWYGMEERELMQRFGDAYGSYRERTPAVIPQGLAGERALWQSLFRRSA